MNLVLYIQTYVHVKKEQVGGGERGTGILDFSKIGQDRQALLAVNLGGVGASIHEGQSREEGLALILALEGQL